MRNISFVILILFFSCARKKHIATDSTNWVSPKNLTPCSFLELVKQKGNVNDRLGVYDMTDDFPNNWIKHSDIDTLITLVNSKASCNCFLNPFSSYIPHEKADLGGYAIKLIKFYKENKKVSFGLYSCPTTNEKEANELIKWWSEQKK